MQEDTKVKQYFNKNYQVFDGIYTGRQSIFHSLLDKLFRRNLMSGRLKITLRECEDIKGKRILDIGCGAGWYAIELVKRGASEVVGVDFSGEILELAKQNAVKHNVSDKCKFIRGNFMDLKFDNNYDIAIALGVIEYISDPRDFISKMLGVAKDKIIVNFAVRWSLFTPLRKLWLSLKDCPVYFINKREICGLFDDMNSKIDKIILLGIHPFGDNYIVVAKQRA
jgi:ubiquinone/menaquinone biosynthesis C-methylase UbiE